MNKETIKQQLKEAEYQISRLRMLIYLYEDNVLTTEEDVKIGLDSTKKALDAIDKIRVELFDKYAKLLIEMYSITESEIEPAGMDLRWNHTPIHPVLSYEGLKDQMERLGVYKHPTPELDLKTPTGRTLSIEDINKAADRIEHYNQDSKVLNQLLPHDEKENYWFL